MTGPYPGYSLGDVSLGNGPLPDDGIDRTPTERHLYNTRESYISKGWAKHFLCDGRVRYLERSSLASCATNRNTFLGLPCDHKDSWFQFIGLHPTEERHSTAPSKTTFVPCGQKVSYYFNGYGCSPDWLLKGLMTLPLSIRENIFKYVVNCQDLEETPSLFYWVTTDDVISYFLNPSEIQTEYNRASEFPMIVRHVINWGEVNRSEFCWKRGYAEALRGRGNDGSQEAKHVLIDFLGYISMRVVWCVKCCNQSWLSDQNTPIIEKSLTWLKRNKLFHPCMRHISIDFEPRDESSEPFSEDFVALCSYMSVNLPSLESVILWLKITEDDFYEVLKAPMRFSWVQAFRALPVEKVEICPLLTNFDEPKEAWEESLYEGIKTREFYCLGGFGEDGLRTLLINDPNKERDLITHILTPGSKLWGFTDDIDDDAYISLQNMESWNEVQEKFTGRTPRRFKKSKANGKFLRLQKYQLPRQSPPNQQVPPERFCGNAHRSRFAIFFQEMDGQDQSGIK